uniref:Uncharacterized protein n=1 Tax=Brassica oleracea TaxID=3712 RepID=A0A3P6FXA5_BRAOL|nr:unnamed protein product [Brassica oleracea]
MHQWDRKASFLKCLARLSFAFNQKKDYHLHYPK